MSMKMIEIGIPFFDDINKQGRNKSYFNAYLKEWICPKNRLLSFQVKVHSTIDIITDFDLINVDTGDVTDILTYINANTTIVTVGDYKYILHSQGASISLTPGRYYIYTTYSTSSPEIETQRWSEVFTVTELEE